MEIERQKLVVFVAILMAASSIIVAVLKYDGSGARGVQTTLPQTVVEMDGATSVAIAEATHEVVKSVVSGGVRWIEMRAGVNKDPSFMGAHHGLYELWRVPKDKAPMLVTTLSSSLFSRLDWGVNKTGGIDVAHWDGGPEGGRATRIIYDAEGVERARLVQDLPDHGDEIVFEAGPAYTISYILKDDCSSKRSGDKVELEGIALRYGQGTKNDYFLLRPKLIECVPTEGDPVSPRMTVLDFQEHSLHLKLPGDVTATIFPGVPLRVTFEE